MSNYKGMSYLEVMWWCYWYLRLAIYRSRVRVLAGHHCIVALGKLCAYVTKQYNLVLINGGDLFGWKSNRGPGGVTTAYHGVYD